MRLHTTLLSTMMLFAVQAAQSQTPDTLWGVNSQKQVWHQSGGQWQMEPGTMKQVSEGADGTVWAVDPSGNIYAWTGSGWQTETGQLAQVSVGSASNIWGANSQNAVWHWDGSQWNLIEGWAQQVSVGTDGTVWQIDPSGFLYQWTGAATNANGWPWTTISGSLAQVSVGTATNVWGVNSQKAVWRWDGSQWHSMPGTMQQVTVAPDGNVYAVDPSGNIYSWSGSAWQSLPGALVQISAGNPDRFEENNPAVKLQGSGWSLQTNPNASGGGYAVSSSAGSTVTFSFTGDSIALFRTVNVDGGQATVTLDGNALGYFDFYFQQERWQVPTVLDHLGSCQHTLVLTVSSQKTSGSTGNNVYIDAFSVPTPFTASTDQQAGLTQVNYYRTLTGLPPVQLDKALDLAAQAHADYNALAGVLGHTETLGNPGFTGANPAARTLYFGYSQGGWEDAAEVGATASVDTWMFSVYHRQPIMIYALTDAGLGVSYLNGQTQSVLDMGSNHSTPPANRVISTYPVNNQTEVQTFWNVGEIPSPVPQYPTVGPPISLHIAQPATATASLAASATGTLTDATGHPVNISFLMPANDPNQLLVGDNFYIVPLQPLTVSSAYTANISGTDTQGAPFNQTWTFTTVPAAGISGVLVFNVTTSDAWVQWVTAGPVTSTSLSFGATTTYGAPIPGTNNLPSNPNQVAAHLTGLSAATTYHYQITATDGAGNTRTTADATFTTPAQ
jgi:virginiamycin B lyase